MKDIVLSSDIINEYIDDIKNEYCDVDTSLNQYLFEMQDCNDGKLLLDVPEVGKIKYAFLNNNNELLSPEDYMEWDEGISWKEPKSYRSKGTINTCIRNIKRICKIAEAMTYEEVKEFLEYKYSVENC